MILDKLKELETKDQMDAQHLSEINILELIKEVKDNYSSLVPIDWNIYVAIPQVIVDNLLNSEDEQFNLINNIFYEEELLQIMYMQSKGLESVYAKVLIGVCNPAMVCNEFNEMLSKEPEYNYLHQMYHNYCERSLSTLGQQMKLMQSLNKISMEDLTKVVNSIKEITQQGE